MSHSIAHLHFELSVAGVLAQRFAAVENYTAGQEALHGLVICGAALEFLPHFPKP